MDLLWTGKLLKSRLLSMASDNKEIDNIGTRCVTYFLKVSLIVDISYTYCCRLRLKGTLFFPNTLGRNDIPSLLAILPNLPGFLGELVG